jgi:hypothetical protein
MGIGHMDTAIVIFSEHPQKLRNYFPFRGCPNNGNSARIRAAIQAVDKVRK